MKLNRLMKALSLVLMVALLGLCFTGCATTAATGDAAAASGGGSMIVVMVIMIAVFYFFLIRPENKKKKKLEEMRNSLSVGDDVTTIGGIVGKVVAVKENYIVFETGEDRVRLQVTKWAISTNTKAKEEPK